MEKGQSVYESMRQQFMIEICNSRVMKRAANCFLKCHAHITYVLVMHSFEMQLAWLNFVQVQAAYIVFIMQIQTSGMQPFF
jgi:hypothetical protein